MESSKVLLYLVFLLLAHTLFVNAAAEPRSQSDIKNTDFQVTLPLECIGKELCSVKPIDYPTAIMDREAKLLMKRSRRESPQELVTPRRDGNNCVKSLQQIKPYVVVNNGTQHVIVQSSTYNQYVTGVVCRSAGASCFGSLNSPELDSPEFYCETVYSTINLTAYNFKLEKPEDYMATVPVGCGCVRHRVCNV